MKGNSTIALRLKVLPRQHRIARLRALIGLEPKESNRREQLLNLLHAEISGVQDD